MTTCTVLMYDHECKPLRISGIDVFLFKGRSEHMITSGLTGPMPAEAAYGVTLEISVRRPVRVSLLIHDSKHIYSGNSYVNLHGGLRSRLDLVLLANPRSPGGLGESPDLNPPDGDDSGLHYIYRAIQEQRHWSEVEKEAVVNLVTNFAAFIEPKLGLSSSGIEAIALNWEQALRAVGIDSQRLISTLERVSVGAHVVSMSA